MQSLKNNRGQGLVEYILIVMVMGILAITVVQQLATTTQTGFSTASSKLSSAFGR
jgi:Flp pilus assembly pilin Flp